MIRFALALSAVLALPLASQNPPSSAPAKRDYSASSGAPYTAQDVVVPTPMGHTLAGTLTLPKGASGTRPVAAVITISGTGPQDRDEYLGIGDYRPFRQFADSLSRRGVAVLRMDDRGVGGSGGTFKRATDEDFARDIKAGLTYLRTRPEIDAKRLALLGHSEGTIIASMVAAEDTTLRALALLAGVATPVHNALRAQLANLIRHNDKLTQTQKDSALAAIPRTVDSLAASDPWWDFILKFDPSATARRIRGPAVLIITGANDQQADPKEVTQWAGAFFEAGNRDLTAIVVPDVNHLFIHDKDGFPGGYAKLPPPLKVEQHVVGSVVEWLAQRLR